MSLWVLLLDNLYFDHLSCVPTVLSKRLFCFVFGSGLGLGMDCFLCVHICATVEILSCCRESHGWMPRSRGKVMT